MPWWRQSREAWHCPTQPVAAWPGVSDARIRENFLELLQMKGDPRSSFAKRTIRFGIMLRGKPFSENEWFYASAALRPRMERLPRSATSMNRQTISRDESRIRVRGVMLRRAEVESIRIMSRPMIGMKRPTRSRIRPVITAGRLGLEAEDKQRARYDLDPRKDDCDQIRPRGREELVVPDRLAERSRIEDLVNACVHEKTADQQPCKENQVFHVRRPLSAINAAPRCGPRCRHAIDSIEPHGNQAARATDPFPHLRAIRSDAPRSAIRSFVLRASSSSIPASDCR